MQIFATCPVVKIVFIAGSSFSSMQQRKFSDCTPLRWLALLAVGSFVLSESHRGVGSGFVSSYRVNQQLPPISPALRRQHTTEDFQTPFLLPRGNSFSRGVPGTSCPACQAGQEMILTAAGESSELPLTSVSNRRHTPIAIASVFLSSSPCRPTPVFDQRIRIRVLPPSKSQDTFTQPLTD